MKKHTTYSKKLFLLLLLNAIMVMQSKSQNMNWDKSYSDGSHECHGYSIQPVSTGGYIVCGGTVTTSHGKDIYVIKTDEDGDTLWTKTIGGTNDDEGYCVRECNDGGFMIAGYTGSYGNGAYDFFLVKTDEDGAIEYTRTNGGTLNEGSYNIIQTNDSGYLAVGYSYSSGHGGSDVKAVKYSKTGQVEWSNTYGTAYNEFGYSVCQMRDTGYVICGSTARGASDSLDVYVIRTNKSGDTLWTKTYKHEGFDCAYSVYACAETGFVIAGKTNLNDQSNTDMLFMKIFDDGTEIFTKTYGQSGYNEIAYDVKETDKNNFVLVGTTDANSQGIDGYVVHTDDHGELLEETYYGGEGDDEFRSVCMKNDDEFAVTGTFSGNVLLTEFTNCVITLPRTLWFNGSWEFNNCDNDSKKQQSLFITDSYNSAATKTSQFVQYCLATKIHTVVLGRIEDIIRQDYNTYTDYPSSLTYTPCTGITGANLRTALLDLVNALYTTGQVAVVLAQWRDADKEDNSGDNKYQEICGSGYTYPFDEDEIVVTHNEEILSGFESLNDVAIGTQKFDGVMLDYEYFTPTYGDGTISDQYHDAKEGFYAWLNLASYLLFARYTHGINIVQAYLARIVFMKDATVTNNYFDADGDLDTDIDDSHFETDFIDGLGFDKLALAFFVEDREDLTVSQGPNPDPSTFLSGFSWPGGGGSEYIANGPYTDEQLYRYRLEMLGDDPINIRTKFEPVFMARSNSYIYDGSNWVVDPGACGAQNPMLGNLMLKGCYWDLLTSTWPPLNGSNSEHYLPEIETYFYRQYLDVIGYDNQSPKTDPAGAYGTTDLVGFQWYQYSTFQKIQYNTVNNLIGVLSYPMLSTRAGDQVEFTASCDLQRAVNPTQIVPTNEILKSNSFSNTSVTIFPNPMADKGGKIIVTGMEEPNFKFNDPYGKDVTSLIDLQKTENNNYYFVPNGLTSGVYIVTVTDAKEKKIIQSFSVVK